MKIAELTTGQGNVNVDGTISNIGDTRSFNKFGRQLTVANAMLNDDSGSIKLTLWNDDVKRFKEGDKIRIINGYVGEFQGEKQLTAGKFGSIEKVDSANVEEPSTEEPPAEETSENKETDETVF